ncbi:transposable element tc3 transposase-like protein [Holotrichia oblita]|uniref:Transposable element tc3 transposase-like protein n=1 Tax=Holotrichia oblita TaxID=644536 RepID=A0ACB9SKH6_HOLOL|nr:transposable element tc3 transposase-like protein [Holotrichia oblita]
MDNNSFEILFNKVKAKLTEQDTVMRGSIPARSKESGLCKAISTNSLNFPDDQTLPGQTLKNPFVIVADDAFPLLTRIMKLFVNRGLGGFRVLMNPIQLSPDKVVKITLACIALHNFLATENWSLYTKLNKDENRQLPNIGQQCGNRSTVIALQVRENFKNYFNSEVGAVEWQSNAVLRHNM